MNKCFSNMIRQLVIFNSIDVNGRQSFGEYFEQVFKISDDFKQC